MELDRTTIRNNVVAFLLLGLLAGVFGLSGTGAIAVLMGFLNLFLGLLFFLARKRLTAKTCLLCAGVLLLVGFSLCTAFPLNIH